MATRLSFSDSPFATRRPGVRIPSRPPFRNAIYFVAQHSKRHIGQMQENLEEFGTVCASRKLHPAVSRQTSHCYFPVAFLTQPPVPFRMSLISMAFVTDGICGIHRHSQSHGGVRLNFFADVRPPGMPVCGSSSKNGQHAERVTIMIELPVFQYENTVTFTEREC